MDLSAEQEYCNKGAGNRAVREKLAQSIVVFTQIDHLLINAVALKGSHAARDDTHRLSRMCLHTVDDTLEAHEILLVAGSCLFMNSELRDVVPQFVK